MPVKYLAVFWSKDPNTCSEILPTKSAIDGPSKSADRQDCHNHPPAEPVAIFCIARNFPLLRRPVFVVVENGQSRGPSQAAQTALEDCFQSDRFRWISEGPIAPELLAELLGLEGLIALLAKAIIESWSFKRFYRGTKCLDRY